MCGPFTLLACLIFWKAAYHREVLPLMYSDAPKLCCSGVLPLDAICQRAEIDMRSIVDEQPTLAKTVQVSERHNSVVLSVAQGNIIFCGSTCPQVLSMCRLHVCACVKV